MAYFTQAVIADDAYMRLRVSQAAAQEGCAVDRGVDPDEWTLEWRRVWSSAPGWDAAWESAVAGNIETPGIDPGVITDGMILAQIQSMMPFTHVSDHQPLTVPQDQAVQAYIDGKMIGAEHGIDQLRLAIERTIGQSLQ